jgi:hypothetical protein
MSGRWSGERWWDELTSDEFGDAFRLLSGFHRSAQLEVCRLRTEPGFQDREDARSRPKPKAGWEHHPGRYVLRIVNPDGAVIRDGIEIDYCANVGSYDQGTVVEADDRCINESGVMRYRGPRGWVSECTRGQGREPICEVVDLLPPLPPSPPSPPAPDRKGQDRGVTDLATVGANALARMQGTFKAVLVTLSKCVMGASGRSAAGANRILESWAGRVVEAVGTALETSLRAGLEQVTGPEGGSGGDYLDSMGAEVRKLAARARCAVPYIP